MEAVLEVFRAIDDPVWLNRACEEAIPNVLQSIASTGDLPLVMEEVELVTVVRKVRNLLSSSSERVLLVSMTVLSWVTSGCIDGASIDGEVRDCLITIAQFVRSTQRDCRQMSLFVRATCVIPWIERRNCRDIVESTLPCLSDADTQIQYWAYRAVVNEAKLYGNAYLSRAGNLQPYVDSALLSLLGSLTGPEQRIGLLRNASVGAGPLSLVSVQIEFLLLVHNHCLFAKQLKSVLDLCPVVCTSISEVLKRGPVAMEAVATCCAAWRLLMRVSSLLLWEPTPHGNASTSTETVAHDGIEMMTGLGTTAERREAFMNLLAPKNGVGVFAAPLQYVLKRSKLQAALCYEAIAVAITQDVKDWHEPPAALKLLLRCLHHLLCSDGTLTTSRTANFKSPNATTLSKRKRQGDGETVVEGIAPVPVEGATGAAEHSVLVQDNIDQEWNEVAAAVEVLHAAGRALVVLCSAVDRRNLDAVLAVSVSMGRPTQRAGGKSADPAAASGAVLELERTSLSVILSRLLESCDGVQMDTLRSLDLLAVQKVYIAVTCTAQLHRYSHLQHSTSAVSQDENEDSSTILSGVQPCRPYERGLFATDVKLGGKRGSIPEAGLPTYSTIFVHMQQLHSAIERVTRAHQWQSRIKEQFTPQSEIGAELPLTARECKTELVASFQTYVIALGQILYAELAPITETSPERSGKSPGTSTPAVLSLVEHAIGPLGALPLETALGPTPRAAPQLFAYSSQLSQPFLPRHRGLSVHGGGTKQSPVLTVVATKPGDAVAEGVSYGGHPSQSYAAAASQVLLGSAHPPAVQAALDLCGVVVKMWVDVWMNSSLEADSSEQRGLVVEALWWFLQRTSTLAVEVRTEDLALLQGAVEMLQPGLCPARCPDNAAGLVMLLALSHADMLVQGASSSHQDPRRLDSSTSDSVELVERAVECCMVSMTEVGVLPSLFEWLPHVLAATGGPPPDHPSDTAGTENPGKGREVVLTVEASVSTATAEAARSQGPLSCQRLIGRFIAMALEQLAGMTLPTASEQHSPGLMSSMISGLGHLLVSPLVMAIRGDWGLQNVLASAPAGTVSASSVNPTLENWRKILQIWLELREFARSHGIDGESIHTESEGAPGAVWVDGLLGVDPAVLAEVLFRGVSLPAVATDSGQLALRGSLVTAECMLRLAQATVECVAQHRRKYPRSELTDVFAVTAAGLLTSVAVSLPSILTHTMDMDALVAVKDIVATLLSVVPVSSVLLAGQAQTPVIIALQTSTSDQQPPCGYVATIFSSVLQLVVCVHQQHRAGLQDTRESLSVRKCEQQWLLAALTGLCAAHSSSAGAQNRGAFRSAAASLSAGLEFRAVVMRFVQQLGATLDTESAEMVVSAWTGLGGEVKEIQRVLQPSEDGVVAAGAMVGPKEGNQPAQTVQTVPMGRPNTPTTGTKRSFIPAPASAPVMARGSTSPPASHKKVKSSVVTDRLQPSDDQFVKIGAAQSDLDALAAKAGHGSRARQGIVPATYTGADRVDLYAQSQQQLQSQQQHSQRQASQVLVASTDASAPAVAQLQIAANQPIAADAVQLASPSGFAAATVTAPPQPATTQPHSDSTTYVSPSPAQIAGQQLSSAAITRLQSGYFHSHFGSLVTSTSAVGVVSLRSPDITAGHHPVLLRDSRVVTAHVSTDVADLQRHSQLAQLEISGEDGGAIAVDEHAAAIGAEGRDPTRTTEEHAERSAEAIAAVGGQLPPRASASTAAAVRRTQQRLRDCLDELLISSGATTTDADDQQGAVSDNPVDEVAEGSEAAMEEALNAAIRDSHRLTGLLLELWHRSRSRKP